MLSSANLRNCAKQSRLHYELVMSSRFDYKTTSTSSLDCITNKFIHILIQSRLSVKKIFETVSIALHDVPIVSIALQSNQVVSIALQNDQVVSIALQNDQVVSIALKVDRVVSIALK